jgi:hypothetical protein
MEGHVLRLQLKRWRPYLVALLALGLIAFVPSRHGGSDGGRNAVTRLGTDDTTADGLAVDGPEGAAGQDAAIGGGGPRAATAAAKGRSSSGSAGGGAAATGAGMGSPAALAAPDCDPAVGKIKISYTWRPACVIPWPAGSDNGGATSMGVTATSIKVVRYNDPVQPISASELKRKWQTSIELFEHFYRMWGRKVENIVIDKSGDDEVAQRADAVKIAGMKPFAAIGVPPLDTVLITELAQRGIVVITSANVTVELTQKLAPYVWGVTIQPDELVELNIGEYAGRRLLGHNARWAGQAEYRVMPRKFGLVYPDNWDLKLFTDAFGKHGGKLTDALGYEAGQDKAATWTERSRVIAARLKDKGVTSVIAATDLLFTGPLTQAAASQNWFPEWITTGYLAQDLDLVAKTFNQAEWQHAFGVGGIPVAGDKPWPQYWFYLWYWGTDENQDGPAHSEATVLFSGIHGAGPHLTPETFRDGVFALPPTGGSATGGMMTAHHSFGRHGFFPWDDYNAFDDFDELYWDSTAVAPDIVTGQPTVGHYRHLNGGRRYLASQWPDGEPAFFDPAGTVMWYTDYPPSDRPPDYPCTGCPSQSR